MSYCSKCGNSLPGGASGICPKCLLSAGLENASQDHSFPPTMDSPRSGEAFVAPIPQELAANFPQLEIIELLGRGGMGAVYKARQRGLDRLVALKILPPEVGRDQAFAERFEREARALARLNHPHVVTVHDIGRTADGLYYFIMEYVDGINLRQAIKAGSLAPQDALAIVGQICDALQYAHDMGVVHRDIKPENVLLDRRGQVKIADFGLAKLLGNEGDVSLTHTHQVMGTLRYMAPEQMEGTHHVDHRADIYSLGVLFYELLTGELPIGRFAPPSKKVHIDVRLDEVVLRALEKEPDLRYQQVSEVKTGMEAIYGQMPLHLRRALGQAERPAVAQLASPPPRPWLVPLLATLNVVVAVVLMMVCSYEDPTPFKEVYWQIWEQVDNALCFIMAALLFVASIGLFLWKPWARKMMVVVCIYGLASLVVDMPFLTRAAIPHYATEIHGDFMQEGTSPDDAQAVGFLLMTMFIGGGIAVGLVGLIGQLVYFTRPNVIAAFERGREEAI